MSSFEYQSQYEYVKEDMLKSEYDIQHNLLAFDTIQMPTRTRRESQILIAVFWASK